jgi:hypothetical protein
MADDGVQIPPLVSGGVMLSYRCSNTCRHCLYRCSPRMPDTWMSAETIERAMRMLADEPRLSGVHLAGGEPTLRLNLLVAAIEMAGAFGVGLSYVETNGHWCTSPELAEEGMRRMKEAGLPAVLVSVSMFHNEFVPFRSTRNCVEAARKVFGHGSTCVYLPHLYALLAKMPDDGRHTLEEFCSWAGIADKPEALAELYYVIPNGRAATALAASFASRPASDFRGQTCFADLMSTSHFHIDHHGDLFTGLCAGLAVATIDDPHPYIDEYTQPIVRLLMAEGPLGLMAMAQSTHGYEQRERGYVSKCDLCLDVRDHLFATGVYAELRPAEFYDNAGQ